MAATNKIDINLVVKNHHIVIKKIQEDIKTNKAAFNELIKTVNELTDLLDIKKQIKDLGIAITLNQQALSILVRDYNDRNKKLKSKKKIVMKT